MLAFRWLAACMSTTFGFVRSETDNPSLRYARADLYLLDDVLAAGVYRKLSLIRKLLMIHDSVDAHVARHLFGEY